MANVILTPQTWVNVSPIGENVVVNSKWQIKLDDICLVKNVRKPIHFIYFKAF